MARDPGSLWSPLREWSDQGSYVKDLFIVHSTGDRGSAEAIYAYFNRPTIEVESTFVIGLGPEDPTRQLLDSSARADANVAANRRGISVEVVGRAEDPFTEWQISELIRIGRWAAEQHPIELRITPSPDESGFGWHIQFGSPGPWTGKAKECPGKTRIKQLKTRVFPAIFNDSPEDGFLSELTPNEQRLLFNLLTGAFMVDIKKPPFAVNGQITLSLAKIEAELAALKARVNEPVKFAADEIAEAVVDELVADLTD